MSYGPFPWTKNLSPSEFWITSEFGYQQPTVCDDPLHVDSGTGMINCFKAHADAQFKQAGWFGLRTLINVSGIPGTTKVLKMLEAGAMQRFGGAINLNHNTAISVWTQQNGTKFGEKLLKIDTDVFHYVDNKLVLNQNLTGYSTLYAELWMANKSITPIGGWSEIHVKDLKLTVEYYTDIPPALATFTARALDWSNFTPISGAEVTLLSGDRVVAGPLKTDSSGYVTVQSIPAGTGIDYGIRIVAKDYLTYSGTVRITAPATDKEFTLVYSPAPPFDLIGWLEEYWYIPTGIGAGVLVLLLLWPKSPITIISPQRAE